MIFHSLDFLVFFVAVVALYWMLPHRGQNILLLVASYCFYGYIHPWFLILIAVSTVIDYCAARGMERWPRHRVRCLWLSVISNFGMLGFFKYFNFFFENVSAALASLGIVVHGPLLRVLLPVGISFYTFQAMSYTIDVYKGELRARRNLLDLAVFISFFPHLVAGPIQRASFLLPQVETPRRFSLEKAHSGFVLICWGFFKKLVIADNVGVIANKVFALSDPTFYILWAGVFAFAIQIYADFSAYTDIARGTSRWLGFELTENFDHPYLASSPADFWRRWNISLSSWFRDYVYIPLGGSRGGQWTWARNVLVTFLLSGLWHGASWNYVLWGLYHGLLLIATRGKSGGAGIRWPGTVSRADGIAARGSRLAARNSGADVHASAVAGPPLWRRMPWVVGMFALTNIGWLIFRETEVSALVRDLTLSPFGVSVLDRQVGVYLFLLALVYSTPLWIQSLWVESSRAASASDSPVSLFWPRVALQGAACGLALVAIFLLRSRTSLDFIYFQF